MKLTTSCKTCADPLKIRTHADDRVELAKDKGKQFDLSCKNCQSTNEYHVDEFSAERSRVAEIIAGLILIIGTPLIIWLTLDFISRLTRSYAFFLVAGVFLIPIAVYGIILKNDRTRVRAFNSHKFASRY